jgi:hypothetical protein
MKHTSFSSFPTGREGLFAADHSNVTGRTNAD